MQGGVMMARNLYGSAVTGPYAIAPKTADGNAIGNRFVILLTDGEPNDRKEQGGQLDVGYTNHDNMNYAMITRSNLSSTPFAVPLARSAVSQISQQLKM